jgi:flagellar motor switch protein FliM
MSSAEILNQEEIDALLKGVDDGAVPTEAGTESAVVSGDVRQYDLATQTRIVRSRMPTLEMINDRFARLFRVGLFNLIRRSPEIAVKPVQVKTFSEYTQNLHLPSSLNLIRLNPLRGTALMMLDAKLVFAMVDNFFGGNGRYTKMEGREFTQTESRVIQMVLRQAYIDMMEAWSVVADIKIEYQNSEINPHFANIVSPSEIVVIAAFRIELETGGGGELHLTMPYSMIEPMREVLDSCMQSDPADRDENWSRTLRQDVEEAAIELIPVLGHTELTLGRLVDLKPGDVIPCDFDGQVTLCAEGVPVLRGSLGASRGQQAVKVTQRVLRRQQPLLANVTAK